MKYLKKYEHFDDEKLILKQGFTQLMENTHLVEEQVNDNLDQFLDELDIEKFNHLFRITKFLGAGTFGAVFQMENGKILKITFDYLEAPFLYEYCKLQNIDGFVKVDDVFKINFGETFAYIIVRDPVQTNLNYREYSEEIQHAKDAMYKISTSWRGTHPENFGLQNGKVVLYDGFCKKVKVDETKIPFLKLKK